MWLKEMMLAGKPDPALFLEAARQLGVEPSRSVVFEDAIAGVEAGRRGRFGLVVGVDRNDGADCPSASRCGHCRCRPRGARSHRAAPLESPLGALHVADR